MPDVTNIHIHLLRDEKPQLTVKAYDDFFTLGLNLGDRHTWEVTMFMREANVDYDRLNAAASAFNAEMAEAEAEAEAESETNEADEADEADLVK